MKLSIFTTILLVLGLNTHIVVGGGDGNSGSDTTTHSHGDFVSSEFN